MPNKAFYVVCINSSLTDDDLVERIEVEFNKALDWFRVDPRIWIVYSSSDAKKWFKRLEDLKQTNGRFFICKLDLSDRQGWMSKEFWTWLKRERT